MYKGHANRIAFIKGRVAQTLEHHARNLKVVGSSPTVGNFFSFVAFDGSWQVDWSYTNEIKHDIHPTL